MQHFPAFCVDEFYEDPDAVRAFALENMAKYSENINGNYPGTRSEPLHKLSKPLFDKFCTKLFSLFYDFHSTSIEWNVSTSFQLIPPYSPDPASPKNVGWIHIDGPTKEVPQGSVAAGIIYLTPDINLNTGTSIFKLINPDTLDNTNNREMLYGKNEDTGKYDECILKHNSSFVETARFNNVYNRLVGFDGTTYHGVNSFYTDKEPRLTQVFFIDGVKSPSLTPILRSKRF